MNISSSKVSVCKAMTTLFTLKKKNYICKSLLGVYHRKKQYGGVLGVQAACEHNR